MRFLLLSLLVLPGFTFGSNLVKSSSYQPDEQVVYLTVDEQPLTLHVFYPDGVKPTTGAPGIVFFHGGGFSKGTPAAFFYACEYLSSRGLVAISAQYRLVNQEKGTTQHTCLQDAKSAMRYIRQNAATFGIDPNKLAAGGGSAGGHLAAALATSKLINNKTDDLAIATKPKALILFNPILGMKLNRSGDAALAEDFSPYHGAHAEIPPTLALWGDQDSFMSVELIDEYKTRLEGLGVRIEVEVYPGQKHSFFDNNKEWIVTTLTRVDKFLTSIGLLTGPPTIEAWAAERDP